MPADYFDRFFVLFTAGFGLLLVGGVNLLLGRRVWLRFGITVAAMVFVLGCLAAFTRIELVVQSGALLGSMLLVTILLGSGWLFRQITAALHYLGKPAPRWSLVTFGGLAIIIGSGIAFERADEIATEKGMSNLELLASRSESRPVEGPRVVTDRGTHIVLKEPLDPRQDDDLIEPELRMLRDLKMVENVIRCQSATDRSNCHGWVFTGGKYLLSPDDVELILRENGYVETNDPLPGDLVIYRSEGKITHSAIVRYVTEGQPVLVEGKWGALGVFLHAADKSCYGNDFLFYQTNRTTHLLVGVGGKSPGKTEEPGMITE